MRAEPRPQKAIQDIELPQRAGCAQCGQPFGGGRFGWGGGTREPGAHAERCTACERVIDRFPAGWLVLTGQFFAEHRQEILRRVLDFARGEKAADPRERIEHIEPVGAQVRVTTSRADLARRLGDLLQNEFGGRLAYRFEHAPEHLRVDWRREP